MSSDLKVVFHMWEERNFRGDLYVSRMASCDRSALRSVLIQAFVHETAPLIPDDDETLMALAEIDDLAEWQRRKPTILKRFYSVEKDGATYFRHPILDRNFEDMRQRALVRSEAAKAGKAKYRKVENVPEAPTAALRDTSTDEQSVDIVDSKHDEGCELTRMIVAYRFGQATSLSPSEQRKYSQYFQDLIDRDPLNTSHWFDVVDWIWSTDNFYRSEQFANCKSSSTLLKSFTKYADKIEQSYLENQ